MKKIFLISHLIFILILGFAFTSQFNTKPKETEISFYKGTLKEAMMKAKKEKKLIFLDVYATWCGPCKQLKKTTFKEPELAEYFNKNFISIEIDGEKGEGIEIVKKYQLKGYPSLLFIDDEGKLINKNLGYYDGKALLKTAKSLH